MTLSIRTGAALLVMLLNTGVMAEPEQTSKPNILLILADDLGYECVGVNGGTSYQTPHLDRLAATGMHVPFIANWPGVIGAGEISHDLIDTSDFLPTLCDVAGIDLPAGVPLDGRSFLPQLRGETGNPRDWIYSWYSVKADEKVSECAFDRDFKLYRTGKFYDLRNDILEESPVEVSSLSGEAAEAAVKLQAALDRFTDARLANRRPRQGGGAP